MLLDFARAQCAFFDLMMTKRVNKRLAAGAFGSQLDGVPQPANLALDERSCHAWGLEIVLRLALHQPSRQSHQEFVAVCGY